MKTREVQLSDEQLHFIALGKKGKNILVDACIGSGKTTSIQKLCEQLPENSQILYLTYNRLLKIDAKAKIRRKNVTVTNYHGFAYKILSEHYITTSMADLIQTFLKKRFEIPVYDVLLIDEYQDIEEELADMLLYIKSTNPSMQIIAVGDMEQKIYDKTTLDVSSFIDQFLDNYEKLTFTRCFRLSADHAAMLGRIWHKPIFGVNSNCIIEKMSVEEVANFLTQQKPKDILCLGARNGNLTTLLNQLETNYPETFNKKTVYASISDDDGDRMVTPNHRCAIFTTYDSSKGLERKICVIFDFTESYWYLRIHNPRQSYEILRHIFCVAASRGKSHIIFVTDNDTALLSEETLSKKPSEITTFKAVNISDMFDFKYRESVEQCYRLLTIKHIESKNSTPIAVKTHDALIDLTPCIGIYQEAVYFSGYKIDKNIELEFKLAPKASSIYNINHYKTLSQKILLLTALETNQQRYARQASADFIERTERSALCKRLKERLTRNEQVQVPANISFHTADGKEAFTAFGLADVVKDNTVYELKFVSELSHTHFLQCACYMVALHLSRGILWNTRTNTVFEITIHDKALFMDAVANAITKGEIKKYYPRKALYE